MRAALGGGRQLARIALRDPEHLAERLTLFVTQREADAAGDWARQVSSGADAGERAWLAERVRGQSAAIARVDGAIAGTPFLVALVPGYMSFLLQEARMGLRIAALYERDPAALRTAAELLSLRGVHPSPEQAERALASVRDGGPPAKPEQRRPLRTWGRSVYLLLVFGGFLRAPDGDAEREAKRFARLRGAAGIAIGGAIWITTWVLPVTFMIAMAWGCETHTRQLGRRVIDFYGGDAASAAAAIRSAELREDPGHRLRAGIRSLALLASVALPIAFVAYADSVKQTTGFSLLPAVGALVALSLVIAVSVLSGSRR